MPGNMMRLQKRMIIVINVIINDSLMSVGNEGSGRLREVFAVDARSVILLSAIVRKVKRLGEVSVPLLSINVMTSVE